MWGRRTSSLRTGANPMWVSLPLNYLLSTSLRRPSQPLVASLMGSRYLLLPPPSKIMNAFLFPGSRCTMDEWRQRFDICGIGYYQASPRPLLLHQSRICNLQDQYLRAIIIGPEERKRRGSQQGREDEGRGSQRECRQNGQTFNAWWHGNDLSSFESQWQSSDLLLLSFARQPQ